MADTIGGQNFIQVIGESEEPGDFLVEITRRGVNGRAFRKVAERAPDIELIAFTDVNNAAAGLALDTTYKAMIGTVVSWSKNGQSRSNYLVRDVRITSSRDVINSVGGLSSSAGHVVESRWILNKQGP